MPYGLIQANMATTTTYAQTNKAIARRPSTSLFGDNFRATDWRGVFNYILVGSLNNSYYGGYLRFQLNIPQGATINTANIWFQLTGTSGGGQVKALIKGEDINSATLPYNLSTFTTYNDTSAEVAVDMSSWGLLAIHFSVITTIIQEIVSRPGWVSGNYINLLFAEIDTDLNDYRTLGEDGYTHIDINYTPALVNPILDTWAVISIEETTATGRGDLLSTGGENCHTRGICWNIGGNPTIANDKAEDNGGGSYGTGSFSKGMTGLDPGTTYYVRAYAINSYGIGYGSQVSFVTKPQAPTNLNAVGSSQTQISLTWNKGTGATNTIIRRGTGSYPTQPNFGTHVYSGSGTNYTDSFLDCNEDYFYSAWSYTNPNYSDNYDTDSGVTYACVTAPILNTNAVSDIGKLTSTGNGDIQSTGGENCTKRGVCWNVGGNPTVSDSKSEQTGSFGTGVFSRSMTGLSRDQTYYVRAYAYNSAGYGYGSQVSFKTKYAILKVYNGGWQTANLKTYVGGWTSKPLKIYISGAWKGVETE